MDITTFAESVGGGYGGAAELALLLGKVFLWTLLGISAASIVFTLFDRKWERGTFFLLFACVIGCALYMLHTIGGEA